ncbi:MAG: heavy metal translocating P-type ATPase [Chitinophagales bacterium]
MQQVRSSETVKRTFPVLGMSCASCAVNSESMVKSLEGVVNAAVSFGNNSLLVEYLPALVSPQQMKRALQSIGYDLIIEEKNAGGMQQEAHEKYYAELKRKTILAAVLTTPMLGAMFFMHLSWMNYVLMALATPVVFWLGGQFFSNAIKQAKHGNATMDTLVALSTAIAYFYSAFVTFFPHVLMVNGKHADVYFESAAFIITFILLGRLLEEGAKSKTSTALKKLIGLQPKEVTLLEFGFEEKKVAVDQLRIADILLVKPGEKIAVDGTIVDGNSFVDESTISGEPIPVEKQKGDKVFAGTLNQNGSFKLRADKVGANTVLAQIIKVVGEAQGSKAPVQKMVDKVAGIFVPVVAGLAILSFVVWLLIGGENAFAHALLALITVLVIACPCALGLATPTAIMVGIGKAADAGILIKDAESLELAKKVNAVVLDKTGTITEGKAVVKSVEWLTETDKENLAKLLLGIEMQSAHPLAEAVVRYLKPQFKGSGIEVQLQNLTGRGVRAVVNEAVYYVGNKKLLSDNGIAVPEGTEDKGADTVFYFADAKNVLAVISVTDKVKESSKEAIASLMQSGIEVYMLTGDNRAAAAAVAQQAGITNYKAELLPADKYLFIKELQAQGKKVAMVGDGINDTQALAQADVSIAMGKGSDIAIDVARMTIVSNDLLKIPQALRLSQMTVNTIRQNLFWAFIYNLIGIPIAAGALYPVFGFMLNPAFAGAAMALSSVSVVSNSLRLRMQKL